ncbi:hypothetical protein Wildcat_98 [Mycobacterium phage Wildcat]|uniref:Uncharacterized protein n=4 Tax=Mycobacterium virus Wildcat TaxID=1993859 RepID=Q19XW2_9CAUD|nr:hypothetical protein Wildcat_98 [Mycobacterium phage Wildcat]AJD82168.1 hypothetical protein COSMO_96 [Mycobacterium phage Cosmo]AQT25767.1 hypothetical protein EniyanLRS_93 [Mycobacterium phage EniyanLRS]QGJ89985.1 hypothetical protein PBI_MARYV_98 [Mycobacterium phage MaryV]WKR36106.1 hypothetical protein [Mycobacterium phage Azrael100]ABE67703.1 hypothetical protein Wildcat_98 [Mycobacterium phage Wildcat]
MIPDGTKRKCAGGDHDIKFSRVLGWHHTSKQDWIDQPHKASPRKYKRVRPES